MEERRPRTTSQLGRWVAGRRQHRGTPRPRSTVPQRTLVLAFTATLLSLACSSEDGGIERVGSGGSPDSSPNSSAEPLAPTTSSSTTTTAATVPAGQVGDVLVADVGELPCNGELALLAKSRLLCRSRPWSVIDATTGAALWSLDVGQDGDAQPGHDHLYVLQRSDIPASGLQSAYLEHRVTAYRLEDGSEAWSMVIEGDLARDARRPVSSLTAIEDPPGSDGASRRVFLSAQVTTLVDPSTGAVLGTGGEAYGTIATGGYAGFGVVTRAGQAVADYESVREGIDALSGRSIWINRFEGMFKAIDPMVFSGKATYVDPSGVVWEFAPLGYSAIELTTGRVVSSALYPTAWGGGRTLGDADHLVRFDNDDRTISCYRLSDLTTPVWTVPADDAAPAAISKSHVAVETAAGSVVILSLTDGSMLKELPGGVDSGPYPVDGLVKVGRSIVRLGASSP